MTVVVSTAGPQQLVSMNECGKGQCNWKERLEEEEGKVMSTMNKRESNWSCGKLEGGRSPFTALMTFSPHKPLPD